MNLIALATEDLLSEALGKRLLAELPPIFDEPLLLRRDGFGYLLKGMPKWRQLAARHTVVVLTDLDRKPCPRELLSQWIGSTPLPAGLLLRIAVRSAEAWVLADHDACAALLGPRATLPTDPEALAEPKQHLLTLARRAPRVVRDDLVREEGATLRQGLGYNARLCEWVASAWSPERAAQRSESLRRARNRLQEAAARLGG